MRTLVVNVTYRDVVYHTLKDNGKFEELNQIVVFEKARLCLFVCAFTEELLAVIDNIPGASICDEKTRLFDKTPDELIEALKACKLKNFDNIIKRVV